MKSPAFQFYPNDWLSSRSVRLMDAEQRGWYIQLLCEAWQSVPQCTLPNDPEILWKLAGAKDKESFNERSNLVLTNFQQRSNMLFNARLERELIKQKVFSKQRSFAGKKSAEKRKRTLTSVESSLNENPTGGQRDSNITSTSTITSTTTVKREPPPLGKLTDLWKIGYKEAFGVEYAFQPKDGVAAAGLLKSSGMTPEALVEVARKAWGMREKFYCKNSVSLPSFFSQFNSIRSEIGGLKAAPSQEVSLRPSPLAQEAL